MATSPAARTPTPREPWNLNRVLVLAGAGLLVVFAALLGGGDLAMLAPGILAAVALVLRPRPWLYLVSGALLALWPLVMLFVFGAVVVLADPTGGMEHLAFSLALGGVFFALLGGIAGFVQGRRVAQPPVAGGIATTQGIAALLVAGMLVGVGSTGALASQDVRDIVQASASNVAADEHVTLRMEDFAFVPAEVTIPSGKLVALEVENRDPVMHTFTWQSENGEERSTTVPPATTVTVLLRFDEPQRVHFWCAPHSQGASDTETGSMWGTLVVQ